MDMREPWHVIWSRARAVLTYNALLFRCSRRSGTCMAYSASAGVYLVDRSRSEKRVLMHDSMVDVRACCQTCT